MDRWSQTNPPVIILCNSWPQFMALEMVLGLRLALRTRETQDHRQILAGRDIWRSLVQPQSPAAKLQKVGCGLAHSVFKNLCNGGTIYLGTLAALCCPCGEEHDPHIPLGFPLCICTVPAHLSWCLAPPSLQWKVGTASKFCLLPSLVPPSWVMS